MEKHVDVSLVSMPFPSLERPSLGLSILASAARNKGFKTSVHYEHFKFAEKIGFEAYLTLYQESYNQLGEWCFSREAFPDFTPDEEDFFKLLNTQACLTYIDDRSKSTEKKDRNFERDFLIKVRKLIEVYIEESVERILSLNPKIVGCTSQFQQHISSLALLRKIKKERPEIITLMGGTSCEGSLGLVTIKNFDWIDYIFSGEADLVFADMIQSILEYGRSIPEKNLPVGLLNKQISRQIKNNDKVKLPVHVVTDIDQTPIADFTDFLKQFNSYSDNSFLMPHLTFETSRGCWWYDKSGGCTFCSITPGRSCFRSKSVERVKDELITYIKTYNCHGFMATDDIVDVTYFDTLFPELSSGKFPEILLFFEIKANLSEEQIINLSNSGARWLQPGIESLNDNVLKLMNKGITTVRNIYLLKLALENGIRLTWHIIYGLPDEKPEWYKEMNEVLPLLYHLNPPDTVGRIHFDKYSEYFYHQRKYNLHLEPHRVYKHTIPLSKDDLNEYAFFFEDKTIIKEEYTDNEHISDLKDKWIEWNNKFPLESDLKPVILNYYEEKDNTRIIDTRPCSKAKEQVLTGIDHVIYKLCRKPLPVSSINQKIAEIGETDYTQTQIDKSLNYLTEMKLLLIHNKRVVSLATKPSNKKILSYLDVMKYIEGQK